MTVRKTLWGSGAGMGLGDKKEEGVRGRSQGSDLYNWLDGCSLKGTSWKRPAVKGGDQHPHSPLHDSQAHRGEAWPSCGPVSHHGGCVAGACPAPPETSPTTARRTHVKIFSPVQSSLSSLIFVLRSRLWAASPILTARLLWLAGWKDAFPSSPGSEVGGDVKEGNSLGNTRTYTLCHTHTRTHSCAPFCFSGFAHPQVSDSLCKAWGSLYLPKFGGGKTQYLYWRTGPVSARLLPPGFLNTRNSWCEHISRGTR